MSDTIKLSSAAHVITLEISPDLYQTLRDLASALGTEVDGVLRRGIACIEIGVAAKYADRQLAIIDSKTKEVVTTIAI